MKKQLLPIILIIIITVACTQKKPAEPVIVDEIRIVGVHGKLNRVDQVPMLVKNGACQCHDIQAWIADERISGDPRSRCLRQLLQPPDRPSTPRNRVALCAMKASSRSVSTKAA